jgi:hypothetical protein
MAGPLLPSIKPLISPKPNSPASPFAKVLKQSKHYFALAHKDAKSKESF